MCVYNGKAGNPRMAASHVPAFLDFRKWLPAICALSRSSASSCQQLARSPQLRATAMLRERRYLAAACALQYMPAFVCQPFAVTEAPSKRLVWACMVLRACLPRLAALSSQCVPCARPHRTWCDWRRCMMGACPHAGTRGTPRRGIQPTGCRHTAVRVGS